VSVSSVYRDYTVSLPNVFICECHVVFETSARAGEEKEGVLKVLLSGKLTPNVR
jgi:hypothetical protein